jgi:peptide/nickel transport system permease protein
MMMVVVFGASFMAYNLEAYSSDPLAELQQSTAPNKQYLIERLTRDLMLDVPPPIRYFNWLKGLVAGLWGQFDLGMTRDKHSVAEYIGAAIPTTFRLVIGSTVLAIVIGITIGMVTAIRQYSRFDYSMTFVAFLLFSLPVFWVAVLLKEYLAIQFNDFLLDPHITWPYIIAFSLFAGLLWASIIGGERRRFYAVFVGVFVGNAILLEVLGLTSWFIQPGLGIAGVAVFGGVIAVAVTQISTGLDDKKALYAALITSGLVVAAYYPLQVVMNDKASLLTVIALFAGVLVVAGAVGYFITKIDRRAIMRTAMITGFLAMIPVVVDRFMQEFSGYYKSDAINGRPIPTMGQANQLLTPEQAHNFWINSLDGFTHVFLPTVALTLISFAGYVRFSRGSLLEVLNMDYIRTARAKGLTERTVIVRHALRNAMLPLTTILVNDFAGVIGGAIITESIFGWKGMGSLFNQAIGSYDLNLFMGVFIISSFLTVLANLVADLLFGVMDPRIRIRK